LIENEGGHWQKNSGMRLEHVFGIDRWPNLGKRLLESLHKLFLDRTPCKAPSGSAILTSSTLGIEPAGLLAVKHPPQQTLPMLLAWMLQP
jgi:hypothetical protein